MVEARTIRRFVAVALLLLSFGAVRLHWEARLTREHQAADFGNVQLNLGLRAKIGQLGFLAALSGFRTLVADLLWIDAHTAWEKVEYGRMNIIFQTVTTLAPHNVNFWQMASWHMAYNASVYVMDDKKQPSLARRKKAQREYFMLGKDYLEKGIANNPTSYVLYEHLGSLYRNKLQDHWNAFLAYDKAKDAPNAATYEKRFAAYELSQCPGHEADAWKRLRGLYDRGPQEHLPTLEKDLRRMEEKLQASPEQRVYKTPSRSCIEKPTMRFAIFGDIHANLEALETVLADARENGCSHFVCLGDVVGYNANPHECLEIVRNLECPVVKGNHDEQAAITESLDGFNPLAEEALNWTREHLTEDDKKYLNELRLVRQVRDFTIVHATLDTPHKWGYVFNQLDASASFSYQHTSVCFFGHTHAPRAYIRDGPVMSIPLDKIKFEMGKKYFINIGSVGQPRDGDWRAAYVIYHVDKNFIELRRLEYDIQTAQKKILSAGLPKRLADRLAIGK